MTDDEHRRKGEPRKALSEEASGRLKAFVKDFEAAAKRRLPEDETARALVTILRALQFDAMNDGRWIRSIEGKAKSFLKNLDGFDFCAALGIRTKSGEAEHLALHIDMAREDGATPEQLAALAIDLVRESYYLRGLTERTLPSFAARNLHSIKAFIVETEEESPVFFRIFQSG